MNRLLLKWAKSVWVVFVALFGSSCCLQLVQPWASYWAASQDLCRAGPLAAVISGAHEAYAQFCTEENYYRSPADRAVHWVASLEGSGKLRQQSSRSGNSDRPPSFFLFTTAIPDSNYFLVKGDNLIFRGLPLTPTGLPKPEWEDFATRSLANKRAYAAQNPDNVKCHFVGSNKFQHGDGRSSHWAKVKGIILLLEELLAKNSTDKDAHNLLPAPVPGDSQLAKTSSARWIWQLDLDTIITNHSIKLENVLRDHGVDPDTGFVKDRVELGLLNLVATSDCNGMNAGSLLWRVAPSTLLLFRRLYSTYGTEVPGLIVRHSDKIANRSGGHTTIPSELSETSALESMLHLLPREAPVLDLECTSREQAETARRVDPSRSCAASMQELVQLLTSSQVREWYDAISLHEAAEALPRFEQLMNRADSTNTTSVRRTLSPRDRAQLRIQHNRLPVAPLNTTQQLFHEQASLRHLLSTEIPTAGRNHTLLLPQHKLNAYPPSLAHDCPPGGHSGPAFAWERSREWRRGDLVAHFPSCRERRLGGDAFKEVGDAERLQINQQLPSNVCGEWMGKWFEWWGKDGLEDLGEE